MKLASYKCYWCPVLPTPHSGKIGKKEKPKHFI